MIPWYLIVIIIILIAIYAYLSVRQNVHRLNKRIEDFEEEQAKNPISDPYKALADIYNEREKKDKGKGS